MKVRVVTESLSRDTEAALLELVDRVRSGEIVGLAAVTLQRGRRFGYIYAGEAYDNPLLTLGAIRILESDLIRHTTPS